MRQKNHNPNALCLALTLLLGVLASTAVVAQTPAQEVRVQLRNGDRITGRLLAQETNHIVIATSWSESLSLPISSITGFETITGELLFTAPTVKPASNPAVVSAPKPPPAKPKNIRASLQFGSDIQSGARDRQLLYARAKASYEKPYTHNPKKFFRTFADYSADYGETENVKSANRMTGSLKTDFDLSTRSYFYNVGSGGYDEIRKIDAHYEVGPGLGYHLIKSPVLTFDVEGGANYQVQFRSAGGNLDSIFIRAAEAATWKLSPNVSMSEKYEFFVNAEDFSQYRFRLDSTLSYKLIENLSLNLTLIDLYDTDPAPNVDRNELQIRTAIGITF